jgi:diphosphomevalonate decarboxylase
VLARRGSGSAARSLWGGFVRQHRGGDGGDGCDCRAPSSPKVTGTSAYSSSTPPAAPNRSAPPTACSAARDTPYYQPWLDTSEADLAAAEAAIAARDLSAFGAVMERSCFKMHACMLASAPPILYWNGRTLDVIRAVWAAREAGLPGFVTSDAGPHVKVLTLADHAEPLAAQLRDVPGVFEVDVVAAGPDAHVEILA